MPRSSKEPAKETVSDLLSELARAYIFEPVGPDEVTMGMMVEAGLCTNHMQAGRILKLAQKEGKLAPPVKRMAANGHPVLAWRRIVK